jgi:hypothetical protein
MTELSGEHAPSCVCKPCCDERLGRQTPKATFGHAEKIAEIVARERARAEKIERAVDAAATKAGERRERRKLSGGKWMVGVWWS